MKTIAPLELHKLLQTGEPPQLLDVRNPAEYADIHVPGVHLAPLDRLDAAQLISVRGFARERPLFLFCRTGSRAAMAAEKLSASGFTKCCVVEGGTLGWAEAGLPVNRCAESVFSLERQVRVASGSLVLTGVLLAQLIHPAFICVSVLVGAGLTLAGVTEWCGMDLLLAKLPWNQRGLAACAAAPNIRSAVARAILAGLLLAVSGATPAPGAPLPESLAETVTKPDADKLLKDFGDAPPEEKSRVGKAAQATRAGNYGAALKIIELLLQEGRLTSEQRELAIAFGTQLRKEEHRLQ